MIAVASRTFIRVLYLRKFSIDDYPFYIAVASLIASFTLLFEFADTQYLLTLLTGGSDVGPLPQAAQAVFYATLSEMFCWLTIFAVKFSFLFYFRSLVRRLPRVRLWWWITLVVLVPVAATTTFGVFIVCTPESQFSLPGSYDDSHLLVQTVSLIVPHRQLRSLSWSCATNRSIPLLRGCSGHRNGRYAYE